MSTIDFNLPCPNADFLTDLTVGDAVAINITALNAPSAVTMTVSGVSYISGGFEFAWDLVVDGDTLFGVTITPSGATVALSGSPTQDGITIVLVVLADANGTQCQRTFRYSIVRVPVDLALVLDRSGSMAWGYDGSLSPPAGERRWDGLLTGVGVLQQQLQDVDLPGDMLGMRLFASSVVIPAAPFNLGIVSMQTNAGQLSAVLAGVTPSGATALGNGIVACRDLILPGTAESNKSMIVFSDGVQNAGDQVKTVAPNQYTHTNGNQKLSGPANEIQIHTICLGSSGHNPSLMEGIAMNNGGQYLNTTAGEESDFETFFNTHLVNILGGSSPQYVDIFKGTFPPGSGNNQPSISASFPVNKGVSMVSLTLISPTRNEPRFTSIVRNGTELIQHALQQNGSGFISIVFRYPIPTLPALTLDGDWTVEVRLSTTRAANVPYKLLVVVDDHLLNPAYSRGAKSFKVNQVLSPTVTLRPPRHSIQNANVQAIVARPGDDINDLIAQAQVGFSLDPNDPNSPDTAKLTVLLQDPAFVNKIKAQDQILALAYNGADDAYKGSFNGLNVAGVYQVVYRVSVDDPELGKIRRYHQESIYVRFPDVDLGNSQMAVTPTDSGATINFRPRASNGKLIGAGWGQAIALVAPAATINNITDNGDGSYTIRVTGTLSGPGRITISDEPVYEGPLELLRCQNPNLNLIQKIQCWLLSLGLPPWLVWLILLLIVIVILWILSLIF